MKYYFFVLTILFSAAGSAQAPVLINAYNYTTTNSFEATEEVLAIYYSSLDELLIGGTFHESIEVSLNNDDYFINDLSGNSFSGMLLNYSQLQELNFAFAYAQSVQYVERGVDNSLSVAGLYNNATNFNLTLDPAILFEPEVGTSDAFIASYSSDNSINWLNTFNGGFTDCQIFEGIHYVVGVSGSDTLFIRSLSSTIEIPINQASNNCFMLAFNENGEITDQFVLASSGLDVFHAVEISNVLNEFAFSGETSGTLNFKWEGEEDVIIENDSEAPFVAFYNSMKELTGLLIILNNDNETNNIVNGAKIAYDSNGNCYVSYTLQQGSYTMILNGIEQDFIVDDIFEIFLLKLDQQKSIQWIKSMPTGNALPVNKLIVDHNGFPHVCGSFKNSIEFSDLGVTYTGGDNGGYLARWTPEGATVWAYSLVDGGLNEINDMCITPQNEMYIGGWFTTFSTDFDFSEDTNYDLGIASYKDPFLAKYTISDPNPDVFIEEGWQTTEVTEGGATDAIYIRLSHAPSSSVQVTATPDAQLDLGNGQGVPVTLSFEANSTAVHQQLLTVAAFDDTAVENQHTGVITFNVTSSDTDFDGLVEQPIAVIITDNDVISVQETRPLEFSISPNPATEDLQINFSIYQNNTPLQIFDETGKLVRKISISGTQHRINISDLAVGTYTIVIQNEKDKYSQVFIKK